MRQMRIFLLISNSLKKEKPNNSIGSSIQSLGSNPWPLAHFIGMYWHNVMGHDKIGNTKGFENVKPCTFVAPVYTTMYDPKT